MSIEVRNLTKKYDEQIALNNISFEIPKGNIVGFLGPNGAGKSTTMKILTGFIPQTSGIARVSGFDIAESPLEVKKRVGYLPEANPLYKDMYVKEYLHYVATIFHLPNTLAKVQEMIAMTGLTKEQDKKIHQLSKGYKQRVGIAQAIIHNPEVLILDEPTSGLDPNQLDEIRKLIVKIGKEKTVLLSTHIMQEVEAMCERVIIINKGEIVADNSTANLRKMGSKEAILTVEFASDISIEELKQVRNIGKIELVKDKLYRIYLNDPKVDIRQDVFQFAVQKNWSIVGMQLEEKDLEGVFKELTNK
ncbi:MAG: gliding motility-associated ABC transporter ATP-binding subunit GldA [Chitinophagales bacterium]|nr:gliding motility-associated ABC transporter ATP-binding subunit GldA [Chitinophagales bacterium]